MSLLPEDVVVEILKRLPFKSVKRFSGVCKHWYALIADLKFLQSMHLYNYYHSADGEGGGVSYLLAGSINDETSRLMVSILSPNHDADRIEVVASLTDQDLAPMFHNDTLNTFYNPILLGPVNGVVCIYFDSKKLALWKPSPNPNSSSSSIGDFMVLPASEISLPEDIGWCLFGCPGFGCSNPQATDDEEYKVVLILQGWSMKPAGQVEIYESRTNCWRKLDVCHPIAPGTDSALRQIHVTYRKTHCCWGGISDAILSFDLRTEEFQITRFPSAGLGPLDCARMKNTYVRSILAFNDCIGLVDYPHPCTAEKQTAGCPTFDLWVLNELGDEESWIKLLRIGPLVGVSRSLCFWKNGKFLLEDNFGNIVCHDARAQHVKDFGFQARPSEVHLIRWQQNM